MESQNQLPRHLLLAVGSRETELRNIVGDQGHGHGVWQLDDRFNPIPAGFDQDVHLQATVAAQMLHSLFLQHGQVWRKSLNVYNSGQESDGGTTGGDYGPDVLRRLATINSVLPAAAGGQGEPEWRPAGPRH